MPLHVDRIGGMRMRRFGAAPFDAGSIVAARCAACLVRLEANARHASRAGADS
ncbi:hypothetical protein BPC006_II1185 [Burkholderia pseudomallei BPC006]|nr:hypothetical protein BPC006_II1185 [Burkholderia pseudomallei BPC006]